MAAASRKLGPDRVASTQPLDVVNKPGRRLASVRAAVTPTWQHSESRGAVLCPVWTEGLRRPGGASAQPRREDSANSQARSGPHRRSDAETAESAAEWASLRVLFVMPLERRWETYLVWGAQRAR